MTNYPFSLNFSTLRSGGQTAELELFFEYATKYLKLKEQNWNLLLNQQGVAKLLTPGRVLLVNFQSEINVPCVLLSIDTNSNVEKSINVLTLKSNAILKTENRSIEDYLALAHRTVYNFAEFFLLHFKKICTYNLGGVRGAILYYRAPSIV